MKLRRSCVSFALALLLSFASLAPCFIELASADTGVSSSDYALGIAFGIPTSDPNYNSTMTLVPSSQEFNMMSTPTVNSGNTNVWHLVARSNLFKPKEYERTVLVSVGYVGVGSSVFSIESSNFPDMTYSREGDNASYTYTDAVSLGGYIHSNITTHGEVASLRIKIPAYANTFRFNTNGYLVWILESGYSYQITSFGAYIIDSGDDAVLDVVEQILTKVSDIETDTTNIVDAVNQILNMLYALKSDTDTIVSMLSTLLTLTESELAQLEKISSSVDAIYYFLTEALKDEAADMSQAAQDAAGHIDNSHAAEEYWQTSMQGNYDSLDLENFTFGGVTSGIELVGRIFQDMFNAFGSYKILFTFPLTLGISLLVVGRLSKFGGGNSSRNKEHKGGEGGA